VNQSGEACSLPTARTVSAWSIRCKASRVRPAMVSHSSPLHGVEPGHELGRGGSSAGVGPGGAHPVGELVGTLGPAGHEGRVRQDRRTEQRVVGFPGGPVTVAKACRLLHAIFEMAAEDRIIARNPCRIAGAGQEESDERAVVPLPVVFKLADTVPVRYRTLILLATFADMRWGELVGLRRENVDLDACEIRITETLAQLDKGGLRPDTPKSRAGRRIVAFPAEIAPEIRWHLERFAEPGKRGFVFVGPKGGQLRRSNFHRTWEKARTSVGLPDLHFHDLRHTGGTLSATTGATLKELMARLGHSSVRAALIYQHATRDRDQAIAKALGAYVREVRSPAREPGDEPERGEQGA
jgi:site-specific recombinase XerD